MQHNINTCDLLVKNSMVLKFWTTKCELEGCWLLLRVLEVFTQAESIVQEEAEDVVEV